jgi:hypothetical protein
VFISAPPSSKRQIIVVSGQLLARDFLGAAISVEIAHARWTLQQLTYHGIND